MATKYYVLSHFLFLFTFCILMSSFSFYISLGEEWPLSMKYEPHQHSPNIIARIDDSSTVNDFEYIRPRTGSPKPQILISDDCHDSDSHRDSHHSSRRVKVVALQGNRHHSGDISSHEYIGDVSSVGGKVKGGSGRGSGGNKTHFPDVNLRDRDTSTRMSIEQQKQRMIVSFLNDDFFP